MPAANASTDASTVASDRRGIESDAIRVATLSRPYDKATPAMPPNAAKVTVSNSSCRRIRSGPPPTDIRNAISRWRADARASSRFATLAQVIASTSSTAPSSSVKAKREPPTTSSWSSRTRGCNLLHGSPTPLTVRA
jgi:hypothetical protein